jgi:hypothetical protein
MGYGVELTRQADEDLDKLPAVVASRMLDELDRLAEDPVALSKPSHFPYLPGRQLFQTRIDAEDRVWWFTVLFRYSEDERNLIILDVIGTTS